jgi:hypothetical protein
LSEKKQQQQIIHKNSAYQSQLLPIYDITDDNTSVTVFPVYEDEREKKTAE